MVTKMPGAGGPRYWYRRKTMGIGSNDQCWAHAANGKRAQPMLLSTTERFRKTDA
ncbi:hypothetical protein BD779DRAFT_260059 [Infundibulicybe gibba]|nr:hypothetical protein BD779DRAFT_260059 [Infundibulicybe gibba]